MQNRVSVVSAVFVALVVALMAAPGVLGDDCPYEYGQFGDVCINSRLLVMPTATVTLPDATLIGFDASVPDMWVSATSVFDALDLVKLDTIESGVSATAYQLTKQYTFVTTVGAVTDNTVILPTGPVGRHVVVRNDDSTDSLLVQSNSVTRGTVVAGTSGFFLCTASNVWARLF